MIAQLVMKENSRVFNNNNFLFGRKQNSSHIHEDTRCIYHSKDTETCYFQLPAILKLAGLRKD